MGESKDIKKVNNSSILLNKLKKFKNLNHLRKLDIEIGVKNESYLQIPFKK